MHVDKIVHKASVHAKLFCTVFNLVILSSLRCFVHLSDIFLSAPQLFGRLNGFSSLPYKSRLAKLGLHSL